MPSSTWGARCAPAYASAAPGVCRTMPSGSTRSAVTPGRGSGCTTGPAPRFIRQQVALPGVATRARREDVAPGIGPPARQGYEMVAGEALPVPQLLLTPAAELAAVIVTGEEKRVGHLAAEPARHVDEFDEPDHRRPRDGQALALHDGSVRLDDLR